MSRTREADDLRASRGILCALLLGFGVWVLAGFGWAVLP